MDAPVQRKRRRVPLMPVLVVAAVAVSVAIVLLALPEAPPDEPVTLPGTPPSTQLARYGVLRRDPAAADRDALRTLMERMAPEEIAGLRADYVRAAGPGLILYSLPYANPVWDPDNGGLRSDPLCISAARGVGCWTADQLAAGASLVNGDRRVGLVPDGVASVTLRLDDGRDYRGEVHDNVYDIRVPAPHGVAPDVRGVTWRNRTGGFAGP